MQNLILKTIQTDSSPFLLENGSGYGNFHYGFQCLFYLKVYRYQPIEILEFYETEEEHLRVVQKLEVALNWGNIFINCFLTISGNR